MTDKLLKGEKKADNKDIIQPQHPYRMCICGSSGSGKTKFCMSLLLEKNQPFDKIIWIAPEYSLKQVKMKIKKWCTCRALEYRPGSAVPIQP